MQFSRQLFGVLFLFFLSLTATQVLAQNSKNAKNHEKDSFPETRLRISMPVSFEAKSELHQQQFKVIEDGVPMGMASFEKPNQSISYGVVIDTSGSMRTQIVALKILSFSLIKHLINKDDMALASLKMDTELVQDLTLDKTALTKSLSDLYTGGGTSIFDGIIATADHVKLNSKNQRQVVILLTDGLEKNSEAKLNEVMSVLSEASVSLFVIQIKSPEDDRSYSSKKKYDQLAFLVKVSGGLIMEYTPPKKIIAAEIDNYIKQATELTLPMIEQLKSKYRISYFSTNNKFDGKARQVKIEWQDEEGKTATQDFSYVVPKK